MANEPHKMTDDEYLSTLNQYELAAEIDESIISESEELHKRYKGLPYGNERAERSSVVSNDVRDVVDADMPSHARVFLGVSKPVVFKPLNEDDENDVKEAAQKTEYVDWIVRGQKDSFVSQHSFLKDVEINRAASLKWYMEDIEKKERVDYENVSAEELDGLIKSLEGEDVKSVEVKGRSDIDDDDENPIFDVEFEVTRKTRRPKVVSIPLENLLFTSGAKNEEDANVVGDWEIKTRGELMQEGIDRDIIASLPTQGTTTETFQRLRMDGSGDIDQASFDVWANETVRISDMYVMIDKDGEGMSRRRHVVKCQDVIISDELFDRVPYVITSAILTSHTPIGESRAQIAAPTALIKTALARGMLDNQYAVNDPMVAVNDNVVKDDLLIRRRGGIIRVNGKENPGQSMFPQEIPFIGDKALLAMQYWDQAGAQTTGTMSASQGLDSQDFEKETATRFNGVQDAGKAKIELVVRVIADAYARAYSGIAWMVTHFQATEVERAVLGEQLKIDPAGWKFEHEATSTVGTGAGDGDKSVETLTGIFGIQQQLKVQGSSLVDDVKVYATIDSILKASDIHDTSKYFNNPERPNELLQRENEVLRQSVEALQEMVKGAQNPLAEAEKVRADAKLVEAKGKGGIEAAKVMEDARQADDKLEFEREKLETNTALELTKIEAETGADTSGAI